MVVDDQPATRAVVRELVDATAGFEAVEGACSAEEALSRLERTPTDLVLMDVRMPGTGGVAAARALARLARRPLVVLFSSDDRPDIEADPPAHGAVAFVRKDALTSRLLRRLWTSYVA
jgi:CheY-like chemotaxis protein